MASLLTPSLTLPHKKVNSGICGPSAPIKLSNRAFLPLLRTGGYLSQNTDIKAKASLGADVTAKDSTGVQVDADENDFGVVSLHHVGILCENLERSLNFYKNILGLTINEARPHDKLPYRGAWLWAGPVMIHLMELPNPDPVTGRPEYGGRDRLACIMIRDVSKLKAILDKAGIPYNLSSTGRAAIFSRDPDGNGLEFIQV